MRKGIRAGKRRELGDEPRELRSRRCVGSEPGSDLCSGCVAPRLETTNDKHLPRRATRLSVSGVAALARTREDRQNCVRFAYLGPQVDRLHVLELNRDVE